MRDKIENASVLVTGGAGFIGSNLVEALLNQGNRVVCLDNLLTGKRENIEPFLDHKDFYFIEGDIRNPEDCRKAVNGVEHILHHAALGSVPRSINDPVTTNSINISGFLNMITAARDAGIKRFVYAASSSTYGDDTSLPKREEIIGQPLSPYAITKYVNELYAKIFSELYDIEVIGLRYFNVFGKHQDPNGAYAAVIPKFIDLLLKGESPVVNGDGSISRDFTYVDNVVSVNQLAALTTNPEAVNGVYNVACGKATSLIQLFEALRKNLAVHVPDVIKINPIFGEERKGDIRHSLASIDRAVSLLGYDPKWDFASGIESTVNWYWKNKNRYFH